MFICFIFMSPLLSWCRSSLVKWQPPYRKILVYCLSIVEVFAPLECCMEYVGSCLSTFWVWCVVNSGSHLPTYAMQLLRRRKTPISWQLIWSRFHNSEVYVALGPSGNIHDERWSEVRPRGGKELDVRVVAHSTVYHARTNSLLVYGGIVAGLARFSKLSDRMFSFQLDSRHWSEIHYPRSHLQDMHVPRERAFHTSTVIGLY